MLWFLDIARRGRASSSPATATRREGTLDKVDGGEDGDDAGGAAPEDRVRRRRALAAALAALHAAAHEACFIANSVTTGLVEPVAGRGLNLEVVRVTFPALAARPGEVSSSTIPPGPRFRAG